MIVIGGYIDFASESDIGDVLDAGRVMAAATLKEPGCIDYCFAVDITNATRIRVFEVWQDQAALDAHMKSAHMIAFMAALGAAKRTGASVSAYAAGDVRKII